MSGKWSIDFGIDSIKAMELAPERPNYTYHPASLLLEGELICGIGGYP